MICYSLADWEKCGLHSQVAGLSGHFSPSMGFPICSDSVSATHVAFTCLVVWMLLPPPQHPVCPGWGTALVTCVVGSWSNVILVGGSEVNGSFMKVFKNLFGEKKSQGHLQGKKGAFQSVLKVEDFALIDMSNIRHTCLLIAGHTQSIAAPCLPSCIPAFCHRLGDREGTTGQGSLWAHPSISLPVSHVLGLE